VTGQASAASELTLHDQLSALHAILALSMQTTERADDDDIVRLAMTAVPSPGRCRIVGTYLLGVGWRAATGLRPELRAELQTQLARLPGRSGPLTVAGERWGWAVALHSFDDHLGFLVVAADSEPSATELFLLGVLAQQTGIALANARLHARQRRAAADLSTINAALTETVAALRRKTAIHERLTAVAVACEGQEGIARALAELTGYPVVVEDRHGNVTAWSGHESGRPRRAGTPAQRERMVHRATAAGRAIRAGGRLVVVARPRADLVGVLALVDPEERAGEPETVALEHAATVLAVELARLRSVADTELRLGRDVVAELIDGPGDAPHALEMARAMGHDLERPHRVLIVEGPDGGSADTLLHSVRHAAGGTGSLILVRAGAVVAVTPAETDPERLRRAVAAELGNAHVRVGVGGIGPRPDDLARSHHEAELALRAPNRDLTVSYENLGVYQLLSEVPDRDGVERFVRRWLGDLIEHDTRRGTALVATTSCFLECGGHYDETARVLGVGRSTLRYRLQRIRQVGGLDLSDTDTRFNLQLACRAWSLRS
jgi:sugar diacid utilization regulator